MEGKFAAKRYIYNNESGYQFEQYNTNGDLICSQFIREDSMEEYLKETGIEREDIIIEE